MLTAPLKGVRNPAILRVMPFAPTPVTRTRPSYTTRLRSGRLLLEYTTTNAQPAQEPRPSALAANASMLAAQKVPLPDACTSDVTSANEP